MWLCMWFMSQDCTVWIGPKNILARNYLVVMAIFDQYQFLCIWLYPSATSTAVSIIKTLLIFFCSCFRFVGPYLKICPEHVFVVEDGDGLCGFAVATSDSKHFYEQFKKHWLPEVCAYMSERYSFFKGCWTLEDFFSFNKTIFLGKKNRWNLLQESSIGPGSFIQS